jgi:4-amino-4-deoxy-L-arabinose transferase-like glycosyltransferase
MAAESRPGTSADPDLKIWLRRLVVNAFLIRAFLAVVFEVTGYSGVLAPDEGTYVSSGMGLALYWKGEILVKPWRFTTDQPLGYFYLNAVFFYLFGASEIPIKLFNSLAGAVSCRYLFWITRELFGLATARRAAMLFAFFPSLALWSALNIRDVWVVLLILFISWKSLQVVKGHSFVAVVPLLLAIGALTTLRDYLFFVVALPPLVALFIGRRGHLARNFVMASVAALGVLVFVQQSAAPGRAESHMSLEAMSRVRQQMAYGGSAFAENVDISTPGKALAFLPLGLAYFMFSPFPWQITSFLKAFSLPEMLVIYYLTPSIIRGIRHAIVVRFRESLQILLLTALLTVSYALGEGNVGTLYRHRAQAIGFYLMFAAVGLELRRGSRTPARPAAA